MVEGTPAVGLVQATAGVAVVREGRILLVRRADDGTWCLPGGRVEFGESVVVCAEREFREETGYSVEVTGLLGVYSEPTEQTHRYPDGALIQFVGVMFDGIVGDAPPVELAGDTVEIRWFGPDELPAELMATDVSIIRDRLARRSPPVVA